MIPKFTSHLLTKLAAPLALLSFLSTPSTHSASVFSFANYSWEQDNTPDTLILLGNGVTLGGATFSLTLPNRISRSVGFIALSGNATAGFIGAPGFDPSTSLGMQATAQYGLTQSDGSLSLFSAAVNLPNGDNGSSSRNGLSMSWSNGLSLINELGNDFVLYESGSNSTSSEGQMVRVHQTGSAYSPWFYRAVDAFSVYTNTPSTVEGAFATAFDLSALGIPSGALIDEIQVANLQSSDRILDFATYALSGEVVFGNPTGLNAKPSVGQLPGMNPQSTFATTALDPDPLYVGIISSLAVPEPATTFLLSFGSLLLLRRPRSRRSSPPVS